MTDQKLFLTKQPEYVFEVCFHGDWNTSDGESMIYVREVRK